MLGVEGLELTSLLLLLVAAFFAGWVDAVVGGGGMVQLPALLMVPGLTPVQALATNKVGSVMGTITSAVTYARKVPLDWATVLPTALAAGLASLGGALLATRLPTEIFKPVIVLALLAVLVYTLLKPSLGREQRMRLRGGRLVAASGGLGACIGFYDGLLGPGTGSFLLLGMAGWLGYSFLQATAHTKVVNAATNLGAILLFSLAGQTVWLLGLALGCANMLGGYLGARTALSKGSGFVRLMLLVVVSAMLLKLGADVLGSYWPSGW